MRVGQTELQLRGHAMAALTVPNAERVDNTQHKSIPEMEAALEAAARRLCKSVWTKQQTLKPARADPAKTKKVLAGSKVISRVGSIRK
jgi:hypothetical protein